MDQIKADNLLLTSEDEFYMFLHKLILIIAVLIIIPLLIFHISVYERSM